MKAPAPVLLCLLIVLAAHGEESLPHHELTYAVLEQLDISGNLQAGEAGLELPQELVVQVTQAEEPVADVPVRFAVTAEPRANATPQSQARLSDTLVRTDPLGFARTRLQLGRATGDYQVSARAGNRELAFTSTALRRGWYFVATAQFLGALALFLFGLYYGSKGLRRVAGKRLRALLFSLTANRFLGVLVGIIVTTVLQSSGATTTLLIGLASAGILGLGQALGVILGADIGTTLTVQALAFRLYDYALVAAGGGFLLMLAHRRLRNIGQAVFGFSLVFFSLGLVVAATEPLRYLPATASAVAFLGRSPWLGLGFALIFTALVRSSAATIGLLVGLSFTGLLDLRAALPFILGANIGTGFAAVLASWRAGVEARRIAAGHVLFKVAVVAVCLPLLPWLARLIAATAGELPRQVANAHTLINLFAVALFLPLLGPYRRLLEKLVRSRPAEQFGPRYLDPRAVETPELAVAQATREVLRMGDRVQRMYLRAFTVFSERDKEGRRDLVAADDQVDELETGIHTFVARVAQEEMPEELSRRVIALFHATDALEHIADIISKNLMDYAHKNIEQGLAFSAEALEDVRDFHAEIAENLAGALACLATWNTDLASRLAAAKNRGIERQRQLQNRHLARLGRGRCEELDTSSIYLDFISDLERVNFQCAQIGFAVLESAHARRQRTKTRR
ncbi:MAG TPA: Na/Pi cotransporter family protein [candidate division WOR-3 bacterium]|uniref:Na/Pi cotransporter family protein n=1 Tax=candidate division WOR-3 bacterium TaxID=2052148 RepID=A0A7V0T503_UNCW3|nr:Na/Pi cotransporter family protein [candidate division WOR-3 bacterium]